jgi:hypothetical protein
MSREHQVVVPTLFHSINFVLCQLSLDHGLGWSPAILEAAVGLFTEDSPYHTLQARK